MTHNSKNDLSPVPQEGEPDVVAMIRKMQQQLVYLEKKIDTLISQSAAKPSRERGFSKPFRSYGPSSRHADGNRDSGPRDGNFPPKRHFDRPRGGEGRSFGPRKGPVSHRRRDHR
jgi:hypothetical protein